MADRLISDGYLVAALAAADPLDPVCLEAPGVAQALTELRVSVMSPVQTRRRTRMTHRWLGTRGFPTPVAIGFAVAVLAAVVSLVGLNNPGGNTTGLSSLLTVTPAQASELDHIAARTAQQAGPGVGEWVYQRYETRFRGGLSWEGAYVGYHRVYDTQQWTGGGNDIERVRQDFTEFGFNTPEGRAAFVKYRSRLLPELTDSGPQRGVTDAATRTPLVSPYAQEAPQNFPNTASGILNHFKRLFAADKARFAKKYQAQYQSYFGVGLFNVIVALLARSTSEQQRAAAFKALAYVPNIKMLGDRKDIRGRTGLAIRQNAWSSGSVETLIVDRSSGNLLQDTVTQSDLRNRTTVIRTVYLQRAIVNSMTAVPGGHSVPYHGPEPKTADGTSGK